MAMAITVSRARASGAIILSGAGPGGTRVVGSLRRAKRSAPRRPAGREPPVASCSAVLQPLLDVPARVLG